jgi:hypothetical protein
LQQIYGGFAILWIVPQNPVPAGASSYAPVPRPASKIEAIGIVITAHNEGGSIGKCIHSLFAANSHSGWHNSLWVVVVADACTDDTAKAARRAVGAFGQVLEVSARSRQAAHRIGTAIAMEHFSNVPRHALLLASPDAAMELRPDWIDLQLQCSHSPVGLTG